MKKLVCMLLALVLALGCAAVCAEEADDAGKTNILVILGEEGGDPAPVYKEKGDTEAAALLKPGSLCGLVQDLTEQEENWYYIVYMTEKRESAAGYVAADRAKILTLAEFRELMQNSDKANEMMDLIDAVTAFLQTADGNKDAGNKASGSGTDSSLKDQIAEFYNEAMDALQELYNMDFSDELDQLSAMGEEIANKAVDVGMDLLETAVDAGSDFLDTVADVGAEFLDTAADAAGEAVGDAGEELKEQLEDGNLSESVDEMIKMLDETLEKIRSTKTTLPEIDTEKLRDQMKDLNNKLGNAAGDVGDVLVEKMNELMDQAKEVLNYGETASGMIDGLADTYRNDGFLATTENLLNLIRMIIGDDN